MDERAIENYTGRARKILSSDLPEWHEAYKEVPKKGTYVLVFFANVNEPYFDVWRFDGTNRFFKGKPSRDPEQDVTHWMYLPSSPTPPRVKKSYRKT